MKKTLSLLCTACLAVGVQAQTLMLNDFESGANGAKLEWGGTAEVVANPCPTDDNSSANVFKVESTEFAHVSTPLALPDGKTLADYTGARLQWAVLEPSAITWVGVELGFVDTDTQEKMFLVASASVGVGAYDTWMKTDFTFNTDSVAKWIEAGHANSALLIKVAQPEYTYVLDNIQLIEKEQLDDPNTIFTFETMDLGTTPRCETPYGGGASCEVAENPHTDGINTSAKVLKVHGSSFSPVTFTEALPAGKTWKDYSGIKFQLCIEGEGFSWTPIEMGVRTDNGTHIKIGYGVDEGGAEGAAFGEYTPDEWFEVELKIDESLITAEAESVKTLYLRLMKENIDYYYDNLTLIPASTSGVISEVANNDMKVYGANGCINVDLQKDMNVTVYSIDGRIVASQLLSSGHHAIDLPKGIYIVNRTKVVVF